MIQKIWNKYSVVISDLLLFILSLYTSLFLSMLIRRPYANHDNITNQFNVIGFNPDTNFLQLIFVIFTTIGLFYVLKYLYKTKYAWTIKILPILLLLLHFIFSELLKFTVGYAFGQGALDTFHSGEQLSPTAAFLSGSRLYIDLFFFRGAAMDVLFPAAGMMLFGETIGAFVLTNHIYMFVTLLTFLILLSFLIKNSILFTITAAIFYVSSSVVLTQPRDIPVFIVIGLIFLLFKPGISSRAKKASLAMIGLLSSLEMYVAIDRGISLIGLAGLLFIILHVLNVSTNNTYTFTRQNIKKIVWIRKDLLPLPIGLLVGFFAPAVFLGLDGFIAFIKISFFEIPSYGGLLVAQPFPDFFTPGYVMWGPVLIAASSVVLFIQLAKYQPRGHLNTLAPLGLLLIYGIVALKFGSNRIDIAKMASVTAPLFLAAVLIIASAVVIFYKNKKARPHLLASLVLSIISVFMFSYSEPLKLFERPVVTKHDIKSYLHTIRSSDDTWMSPELVKVKKYVQSNSHESDYLYSFTADPIYYYATNRKNPTRFYISWYTDPQPYTDEVLRDLKSNPPKIIIYSNDGPWDTPDNIPIKDRIPEVNEWILQNYKKKTVIDSTVILEKS